MFNQALFVKWLWCYGIEREAWWKIVVWQFMGRLVHFWGGVVEEHQEMVGDILRLF